MSFRLFVSDLASRPKSGKLDRQRRESGGRRQCSDREYEQASSRSAQTAARATVSWCGVVVDVDAINHGAFLLLLVLLVPINSLINYTVVDDEVPFRLLLCSHLFPRYLSSLMSSSISSTMGRQRPCAHACL